MPLDLSGSMEDGPRDRPRTQAQHPGRCPAWCGYEIEVGDAIVLTEDGWVHDECAD